MSDERPKRTWFVIFPGDGRLFCSICRTPERWDMRGICACFERVGWYLIDRKCAPMMEDE